MKQRATRLTGNTGPAASAGVRTAINFAGFKLAWLACVASAAAGQPLLGSAAVLVAVLLHLRMTPGPRGEAKLVAAAVVAGLAWDSALVALGLFRYPSGTVIDGLAPHWILAMWALLATTLNVSMRWLHGRPWSAAAFGALGGPLAYWAGARLGAVEMPDAAAALIAQAIGWALMMPALMALAFRVHARGSAPRGVVVRAPGSVVLVSRPSAGG
jgi:hypothetical protein